MTDERPQNKGWSVAQKLATGIVATLGGVAAVISIFADLDDAIAYISPVETSSKPAIDTDAVDPPSAEPLMANSATGGMANMLETTGRATGGTPPETAAAQVDPLETIPQADSAPDTDIAFAPQAIEDAPSVFDVSPQNDGLLRALPRPSGPDQGRPAVASAGTSLREISRIGSGDEIEVCDGQALSVLIQPPGRVVLTGLDGSEFVIAVNEAAEVSDRCTITLTNLRKPLHRAGFVATFDLEEEEFQ